MPRQIGASLARSGGLARLPCPCAEPTFEVKQRWHARGHHDAGNRWLRGMFAALFMGSTGRTG